MSAELRTVMRDGTIYAVANIVSRLAAVILIPVYTYQFTVDEYVFYTVLVAVTELASMLLGMGMAGALSRLYFDHIDNAKRQSLVISTIFTAVIALGIVATVGAFMISPFVSRSVFVASAPQYTFGLAIASVSLVVVFELVMSYFLIRKRPYAVLGLATLKMVTTLAANIVFVVILKMGVMGVLYAMIVSFGITACPYLIHIARTHGMGVDPQITRGAIAFGLPLVPATSANAIMRLVERQLLAAQGGAGAALYGLADRIALLLQMLISAPFARIFLVRRFESLAADQDQEELSRILTLFVGVLGVATLGLAVTGPEILFILAPPTFAPALPLLPWLAVGYMLAALTVNIELGLLYTKRTHFIPIIGISALILSIGLNILLIPLLGPVGAAVSLVVVSLLRLIITIAANTRYGVKEVRASWGAVGLVLTATFALSLLVTNGMLGDLSWTARVLRIIIWFCFVGILFISPVIDKKTKADLRQMIPNRPTGRAG